MCEIGHSTNLKTVNKQSLLTTALLANPIEQGGN